MRLTRRLSIVALLVLAGCADDAPYCGAVVDATGRAIAACPNPRQDPICDRPGEMGHYEETAVGITLVGADIASCNGDDIVVCPAGTEGPPYCITDPEL